jgi:hypothetical protein
VLNAGVGQTLSVTFTPTDAANYTTATRSVAIDVAKATPTIAWTTPAAIVHGTALGTTQLNATTNPLVAGTFAYTVNGVPALGQVLPAGSHTITAAFTPADAVNYTTATATVGVTVTSATTPTITWATPGALTYGTALSSAQLNASADVAGTFSYTVNAAPAAGRVLAAGIHTITALFTPADATSYAGATATVTIEILKAMPTIAWPAPADIVYGTPLGAAQLNASSAVPGTFVYTPAAGTVLPVSAARTLSVTFTPTDAANYSTRTMTVSIRVVKATPVLTWPTPAAITYGTPLGAAQLSATANVAGTFAYSPAAGTILTAGTGKTLSATFTPTDTANYTTATRSVTIAVLQASLEIAWPAPAAVTYPAPVDNTMLNAAVTTTVTGTFAYTVDGGLPAAGRVLNAGAHTLKAVFTPSDANYQAASKTVSLTVLKGLPAISWASPPEITFGVALGPVQLNATANVPGTFSYSPPPGALLDEGQRTLSVTFIPADRTNYANATASRGIRVVRPLLPPASAPAFGVVETPVDGVTGVSGSLGITGWALDDLGVESVQVFRDPLPGEPQIPIFIGNAAKVEGMRPDVQAAFPSLPFAARAGWGYMVLTNMLPNGGNGTFRFHVYATDFEGHATLLGSRTVTCNNAGAVRPFGMIDTPQQGEIVSGVIINWGWALTPQPGSIPLNGSTIDLLIDNVVVGHPTYGISRPDVVALFPGYVNTNTSVGYFVLDTRLLANGTHTIAWIVRDNLGRSEGIGSRFFTVRNEAAITQGLASLQVPAAVDSPIAKMPDAPIAGDDARVPLATAPPAAAAAPASATPVVVTRSAIAIARAIDTPAAIEPAVMEPPPRLAAIAPAPGSAPPRVTVDATTVAPGAAVIVTVANAPAHAKDRVTFYSRTASDPAVLDWAFLNGESTAPAAGLTNAVVTLTAPSRPGQYVVRLMPEGASTAAATSAVITVGPVRAMPRDGRNDQR